MSLPFDVGRIVPSVRDLFAAVATRKRSLTLVPDVAGTDPRVLEVVARHRDSVRALATAETGEALRRIALAAEDVPVLSTTVCLRPRDCQQARYHGADGVALSREGGRDLAAAARSMRMMPLFVAGTSAPPGSSPDALLGLGVEGALAAWLVDLAGPPLAAWASSLERGSVVVVDWSRREVVGTDELRALRGVVDAVIVPGALHLAPEFEALVDELDG